MRDYIVSGKILVVSGIIIIVNQYDSIDGPTVNSLGAANGDRLSLNIFDLLSNLSYLTKGKQ